MASVIAPVWTTRKASIFTQHASEKTLRDLYADEFFLEKQHLVEDDQIEEQYALAILPNHCFQVEPVSIGKRHDSVMSNAHPAFVAKPVQDMQHVCRPYSAQATTLLFDTDVPYDNDEEVDLYKDLYPIETEEIPAPEPAQQIIKCSSTPELLDTSDFKLQPTLTGPLRDRVSEMLDFDIYEVQETAPKCVPNREGRPLVCPIPLYTVAEVDELGSSSTQELTLLPSDTIFRISAAECNSVLHQIPARPFLPGLEHLTRIESHAAFISYDRDIELLAQSSVEFLDDHHHFESPCQGDKVSNVLLPGENFLLVTCSNETDFAFSMQCPSAELLLSLIDELNDCEDDPYSAPRPLIAQLKQPRVVDASRPSDIFDTGSSQFVGYMALDQVIANFNIVSDSVFQQYNACDTVSDISDDEIDELSMSQPSQLTYYDADRQQFTGYTAFNLLLMVHNNEDSLSHVHREDEYLGSDFGFVDTVREMGELRVANDTTPSQGPVPQPRSRSPDHDGVDISYDPQRSGIHTADAIKPRSVEDLQSFACRRSSRWRPNLIVQTHLSDVSEDASDNGRAPCSPASSDTISDFEECRGFVKPTSARRANFLDDEDSDDDMVMPQSSSSDVFVNFAERPSLLIASSARRTDFLDDEVSNDESEVSQSVNISSVSETEPTSSNARSSLPSPYVSDACTDFTECSRFQQGSVAGLELSQSASNTSLPGFEPSISVPTSPIIEHIITLFDNQIWHQGVDLFIAMPLTPVDPCLPSADQFPPADILNSLETELYGLMASLFSCLSSDQFAEALTLGSDLQWAISAITGVYPRLGLMQRLGNTVEILLKRVVALGRR
ncbi:hypothetical protein HBI56_104950 [Parastagonospora nodorum]|nr:hypothetical protein HBI10_163790 [Parastagonospora nodorum]KAH4021617.1 hypothetical protein HBI13_105020 [Parastagonospora nodorum]KAH4030366.1 hypothetical protein HBI09_128510 [Parastagonospora nodorum]KAH4901712.1 hypothetical protein HBI80_138110 [Parastagonospora nodorum]KAH4913149.1 hypothetical protein HBH74_166720 [Parastagonospora nodorum]